MTDPRAAHTHDVEARWLKETYRPGVPQLTVRAVLVGMAIGAVMCLSNLYVFFKTGWSMGVTINKAPNAAMLPPPVIYPAPEATVVRALFSSAPNGRRTSRIASNALNTPKARMHAVKVTPMLQPVLKNT